MGNNCITCQHKPQKRQYHTEVPSDIDNFRTQNLNYTLPKIMFEAEIFNIQIINCPPAIYSINFQIADVISIMLPEKEVVNQKKKNSQPSLNQLHWKLHEKFAFAMNQFQLRSHFLNIQIFGEKKTKINQLSINLYLIATGPQHHDLEVMVGKNKFSRLKFDCKISQVVQVNLTIDQIKIQFDQDWEGEHFDYSFKIIQNNQVVSYSESSHPKIIKSPADKNLYREPTIDDECKSPLKFRKTTSSGSKMIKRDLKSYVEWGEGEKKDTNLMSVGAKLLSNDINKSFFYFLVWKFSNSQTAKQSTKDDWNLFAGVLINFNKLFDKPYQQKKLIVTSSTESSSQNSDKIGFDVEERQITIQQPLWGEDGNASIGKCMIKLHMKNPKFQKQLQACARTQDGIVNMTFLFKSYVGKNTRLQNEVISKIAQKYQQTQQLFRKLTSIPSDSYSHRSQILLLQQEAYQNFKQIANTIRTTVAESLIILSLSNPQQILRMIEDQLVLIEIMNKLYYNINDNTIYAGICWEIVLLIMKRGEFYLENIGFMGLDKSNKEVYDKKLNCAIKYQAILYRYFLVALRNQTSQQVRNSVSSNIQALKAYCYIKIPLFREKIIDSIQKAYDQEIVDFKLQQLDTFTADMSSLLKQKDRSIINLNWDKYFHDQIRQNSQNASLEKQVQEQIQNSRWIQEISKRQQAFFNFTAELVKRLNQLTMRVKTWKWSYFPGYTKIVRGFMVEMKKRKLMDYPQLMIKTSSQLLANQQLVNIMMPIIVEKTNVFSKAEVLRCISMLETFFNCLTQHQTKTLPRTFNYLYFFKSLKMIFETIEHTEAVVRSLILIYDFYEWFSPEWRDNISMYLLGKVFFKLFFHWSFQIRVIFYNFLIIKVKYIRIQKISSLPSNTESLLMNTKIADRYDEITTILSNVENEKKQQVLDYRVLYEKDYYKKMKNKLRKKRQGKDVRSINNNNTSTNLKQNQTHRSKKYSIDNLLQTRTSKKLFLQDDMRNRSSTQYFGQKTNKDQNNTQQKLQITRGSSFCIDMNSIQNPRKLSTDIKLQATQKDSKTSQQQQHQQQQQQTSLQQIMQRKIHTKPLTNSQRLGRLALKPVGSKLNYNIYNREDRIIFVSKIDELSQITSTELNYLSKAIQEYKDTLAEINRYYQKRGELPKRQLEIQTMISDQV